MTVADVHLKPLPFEDSDHKPYWEAAKSHRLAVPRCLSCGRLMHPPGPGCPRCGGSDLEWIDLGSDILGTVYSFVVVHRAFLDGFVGDVPYVVALCDLDLAPDIRITANVLDVDPDQVHIGMRVQMIWEHRQDGFVVPQWESLGDRSARAERGAS